MVASAGHLHLHAVVVVRNLSDCSAEPNVQALAERNRHARVPVADCTHNTQFTTVMHNTTKYVNVIKTIKSYLVNNFFFMFREFFIITNLIVE